MTHATIDITNETTDLELLFSELIKHKKFNEKKEIFFDVSSKQYLEFLRSYWCQYNPMRIEIGEYKMFFKIKE